MKWADKMLGLLIDINQHKHKELDNGKNKFSKKVLDEYNKKYEVDYSKHIAELGKIRQQALEKGAWSAAVNAEVARGKAAGLYIERKIIKTGKLEEMTESQIDDELAQIEKDWEKLVKNVTPKPKAITK